MWITKKVGSDSYILGISCDSNCIEISLFNQTTFWNSTFSKDEMVTIIQDKNPMIEVSNPQDLIKEMLSIFEADEANQTWIIKSTDAHGCILRIELLLEDIPFLLEVELQPAENEKIFNKLISPLVLTINSLESQKNHLIGELKKKDSEIAEYKMNGATLLRKNVETEKFSGIDIAKFYMEAIHNNNDDNNSTNTSLLGLLQNIDRIHSMMDTLNEFESTLEPKTTETNIAVSNAVSNFPKVKSNETNKKIVNSVPAKVKNTAFMNAEPVQYKPVTVKRLKNL